MATTSSFKEQCKNKEADWKGMLTKAFRWSKLRFEFGRYCHVVYPVEGRGSEYSWWEWENP